MGWYDVAVCTSNHLDDKIYLATLSPQQQSRVCLRPSFAKRVLVCCHARTESQQRQQPNQLSLSLIDEPQEVKRKPRHVDRVSVTGPESADSYPATCRILSRSFKEKIILKNGL